MVSASPIRPGLRERKKIRTRQAIRRAAYRLFTERGYEATRVDEIADAAEVSPSTVFRYFPTKEDIVLSHEEDPVIPALRARPADEPPLTALREAFRDTFRQLHDTPEAMTEVRQRMRLVASVPAIRGRLLASMGTSGGAFTTLLAERLGRSVEDLDLRVFASAVVAGLSVAIFHWAEHEEDDDLPTMIDRAIDVLEGALVD